MKTLILFLSFFCLATVSYAQRQILSYEDLKYLIENNLGKADTFLVAKGYTIKEMNKKKNTRKYAASMQGGTVSEVELRADGRKIFVEIQTDDISQYNMIHNSIAQFVVTSASTQDIQTYNVKELGSIYISIADKQPYSPIRKDYDIHLVADKNITSYN
jgi:tRNA threonylcarbamoyladenosine modification (KEOPS) complex  Pcc1 subunit